MNKIEARIVLTELYETRYKIHDHHHDRSRPLASVAMFPSENVVENGMLYDTLEEFGGKNYREIWGLSLAEYLRLPRYMVQMLQKATERLIERRETMLSNLTNPDSK